MMWSAAAAVGIDVVVTAATWVAVIARVKNWAACRNVVAASRFRLSSRQNVGLTLLLHALAVSLDEVFALGTRRCARAAALFATANS